MGIVEIVVADLRSYVGSSGSGGGVTDDPSVTRRKRRLALDRIAGPAWYTCTGESRYDRRSTVLPLALTFLSAALYGLAFAGPVLAPFAWVALVPFLAAVTRVRPVAAAGLGFAMAIAGALGVTWWFPATVGLYFGVRPLAAWAGWLAVCTATVAPPLVCFAAWTSWLAARGAAGPLLVAAGWGACEFARGRLNPWALVGYSQMGWLPMLQIADATGPYGPGMLVAAVNATVAGVLVPALRGRHPLRSATTVAVAVVATFVYGAWRLGESFGSGDPVRVAAVQPSVPAPERRTKEGRALALERQLGTTRAAAAAGAQVIVWPENSIDFYLEQASPGRDALVASLAALDVDVVAGGPSFVYAEDGLRYRNSVYLLQHGSVAGRYDKLHLLPFAEATYVAGTHPYALRSRAGLIGAFVCLEAMYPDLVRRLVVGGATLLANPTNDAWFGAAMPARMHLDMARMRAVEERRWLLRATTTGISAIVDPHGRVVAETARDVPALLEGTMRSCTTATAYQRWGDSVAWLATGVVSAATMMAYRRRRLRLHGGEQ